jgi:hypothetical protein
MPQALPPPPAPAPPVANAQQSQAPQTQQPQLPSAPDAAATNASNTSNVTAQYNTPESGGVSVFAVALTIIAAAVVIALCGAAVKQQYDKRQVQQYSTSSRFAQHQKAMTADDGPGLFAAKPIYRKSVLKGDGLSDSADSAADTSKTKDNTKRNDDSKVRAGSTGSLG